MLKRNEQKVENLNLKLRKLKAQSKARKYLQFLVKFNFNNSF